MRPLHYLKRISYIYSIKRDAPARLSYIAVHSSAKKRRISTDEDKRSFYRNKYREILGRYCQNKKEKHPLSTINGV